MIIWLWIIFALLALDLGVLNREDHVVGPREALGWTGLWIGLSLAFTVAIYFIYQQHWFGIGIAGGQITDGRQAALEFLTGYVIEKSLSLDNIFVIALIFRFFAVPRRFQHRVLFWGVLGALVMRGAMIFAGVALIKQVSWIIYLFGAFLIFTAVKMLIVPEPEPDLERSLLVRWVRRFFPVTTEFEGHAFFARRNERRAITPLLLVLLVVEGSDVVFAVDSIPAIFGVTVDPFIVFTSNIFAILGLRSLYFALAYLLHSLHYLHYSLVAILAFVGAKMILGHVVPVPIWLSLVIIAGLLGMGVLASLLLTRGEPAEERAVSKPTDEPLDPPGEVG
jgi:tellurite resistance protein TerC